MKLTEDDRYALERIYLANMQKDCIRAGMPEHNFDAKLCAAAIRKGGRMSPYEWKAKIRAERWAWLGWANAAIFFVLWLVEWLGKR